MGGCAPRNTYMNPDVAKTRNEDLTKRKRVYNYDSTPSAMATPFISPFDALGGAMTSSDFTSSFDTSTPLADTFSGGGGDFGGGGASGSF